MAIGIASTENGVDHLANSNNSNDDYSDENNPPSSGGSGNGSYGGVLFYQSSNFEETLEADLVEFLTQLFWALDLRRREFLKEKPDGKIPFLCAPFEKKVIQVSVIPRQWWWRKRLSGSIMSRLSKFDSVLAPGFFLFLSISGAFLIGSLMEVQRLLNFQEYA